MRQGLFFKDLWPVHLQPMDDELLSSWIARLAIFYGMGPSTLISFLPPKLESPIGDIDHQASPNFLNALSARTGVPVDRLKATTLGAYEGWLYQDFNSYQTLVPWLLPRTYTRSYKSSGLQFCPQCLAEDDIPYFRRIWRLAFVVLCNKHNAVLIDRCTECGIPLDLFWKRGKPIMNYIEDLMTLCQSCKTDLRKMANDLTSDIILREELEFQASLIKVLNQGWIEIPQKGHVYSHLYFEGIHKLMELGVRLNVLACKHYGIPNFTVSLPSRDKRLERLGTKDRRRLIGIARRFLEDWPNGFINFWKVNNVTGKHLLLFDNRERKELPYWFWSVVQDYLFEFGYAQSQEEIRAEHRYRYKDHEFVVVEGRIFLLPKDR